MLNLPTYLLRRPVRALIVVSTDAQENVLAAHLPEGYLLAGGLFRFPAGYWESYFVDGKEYNYDGTRPLDEQRLLIARDLSEEGFEEKDITYFIDNIPVREGNLMLLEVEASSKWLRLHPDYKLAAEDVLSEVRKSVRTEPARELKGFNR
jgi:hypothetical protein